MNVFRVNQSGLRLDLFLTKALNLSRKRVKKLIDEGRVRVGERKVIIASWTLEKGDRVEIRGENDTTPLSKAAKDYFLSVIYEDDDLIVIEKEAGIACETSPASLTPSLPEIVYEYLKRVHPAMTHPFVLNLHRLDRATSGLMVYGKSKKAYPLLEDFKRHRIGRRYLALVEGAVKKDQGRIDAPLVKTPLARGKKVQPARRGEGKAAITDYRILQRYADRTLLEVDLRTGRTHQVRAHLSSLGHPVVGDPVYGAARGASPSLALHASELVFTHPVSHRKMVFRSKPPKRLRGMVERSLRRST